VPKNKTSHSRKRHRQMAGKALKDVNNLCKCPGCGAVKRTHRLCENCLQGERSFLAGQSPHELWKLTRF
jgi:ribosomal protein L32